MSSKGKSSEADGCTGCLVVIVIVFAVTAVLYLLAGIYTLLVSISVAFLGGLDWLFGAALIRGAPEGMWALWGAIGGAAIGFWTIAPVYGLQRSRPAILAAPLLLMIVVAIAGSFAGPSTNHNTQPAAGYGYPGSSSSMGILQRGGQRDPPGGSVEQMVNDVAPIYRSNLAEDPSLWRLLSDVRPGHRVGAGNTPCIHLIVNTIFLRLSSRNRYHAVERFWEAWRAYYHGKEDAFEVINRNGHRVAGTNGEGRVYLE